MSKLRKNILLSILTAITFLFAGLFFVGCDGVDYSNISISSNVASLELEVGETRQVDFTIENASDSFYKVLRFSVDNESVVSVSNVSYIDNVASVTLLGLAGGSVNLTATSEEGYKWTIVKISVIEHSSTMAFDNSALYLTTGNENSPATSLNLTSGRYIFDANTTDKDMTFYYLDGVTGDVDISSMTFIGFSDSASFDFSNLNDIVMPDATDMNFEGESTRLYTLHALKFTKAEIVDGVLYLYDGDTIVASSEERSSLSDALISNNFSIIAFYNYSVYENSLLSVKNYLYHMHDVAIYRNIGVQAYGGYLKTSDTNEKSVDFSTQLDFSKNLKLIPNNNQYDTYILKLTAVVDFENLEVGVTNESDNLSVEVFDKDAWDSLNIAEQGGQEENVYYVMIKSSSFYNNIQDFSFYIRYEGMENVDDYNVNYSPTVSVDTSLVSTEILLNNVSATSYSSEDNPIYIYNFYRFPEFGWIELAVSLSTGLDTPAAYTYGTITFDNDQIDFRHGTNGEVVSDGQIQDLGISFFYRGRTGINEVKGSFTITVYYVVDESDNEVISVSCDVYYEVIAGAESIIKNSSYGNNGDIIYVDMQMEGMVSLGTYLYTENRFQEIMINHMSGADVVSFVIGENCCSDAYGDINGDGSDDYVLNLFVSPKTTGTGMYQIVLDNGVFVSVTISVINTLQTDNFGVELVTSNNVGYYEYKSTNFEEGAEDIYTNTLMLEILNNTNFENNTYNIIYDSEVGIKFYGNIDSISDPVVMGGNVISVGSDNDLSYIISTTSNGEAEITFTVNGCMVNNLLQRDDTFSVNYYVEVKSYSLLDEFYLMNGGRYAVDNVVYYGENVNLPTESRSVSFDVYANNRGAFGFYKYEISDQFVEDLKCGIIDVDGGLSTSSVIAELLLQLSSLENNETLNIEEPPIEIAVDERYITSELEYAVFDERYIYFYADANSKPLTTYAVATITIRTMTGGKTISCPLHLRFDNGIMFYMEDIEDVSFTLGDMTYNINITFENSYILSGNSGYQGNFDFNTFTYTHSASNNGDFVLHSYLRQRNYTEMQYDANIITSEYIQVEKVSTASSVDGFDFTNGYLSDSIIVFVNPTNATNVELNAQFVAENSASNGLVTANIIQQGSGIYLVNISVEDFYNANSSNINSIESALRGTLYIYPVEWGEDYSVLGDRTPIKIEVSYRNGSEANRYIIDSPEDVLAINNNEETLSSHYEVRTNIDMSTVQMSPIGYIDNKLVGFSGSIIGTTSQAGISNFNIVLGGGDNGTITAVSDGAYYYAGLFAQINYDAYIKNLTISGSINIETDENSNNYYIGLLAGVNYGKLSNVGARISGASRININNNGEYAIGGLVGLNGVFTYGSNQAAAGEIVQNFNSYLERTEEIAYITKDDVVGEFEGQTPRNLAYFNSKLSIYIDGTSTSATLYVGGIVGFDYGDIYRIDSSALNVYGYASYSSYANIEIFGDSDAQTIYAGGAVGYFQANANVSSNIIKTNENQDGDFYINDHFIEFSSNAIPRATIFGLLVGGEVDVQIDATSSAVGGIVGYAGTTGNSLYILGNTSRTFVRGQYDVGGIIGYENYSDIMLYYLLYETDASGLYITENGSRVVLEESVNKIEAVDDGRGASDISMMMLRGASEKATDEQNGVTNEVNYAIGNAYDNGRSYTTTSGIIYAQFDIYSYVSRMKIGETTLDFNNSSISSYYGDYMIYNGDEIVYAAEFEKRTVNLGLQDSKFAMKSDSGSDNVFLMFNFSGMLTENADGVAQDYIDASGINKFSPNSSLYPFALNTRDAQILSTSTNLLRVDADGSLTTYTNGLAAVSLQSILNVQTSINIYLYIVNYLDTQTENSIFYSSNTADSLNIIDGSRVTVYGTNQTTIYAVPTYSLTSGLSYETSNGERQDVIINSDGTFSLSNVSIRLNQNNSVVVDAYCENALYTTAQKNGQSILFFGNGDNVQGVDTYHLTSYLEIEVNDNLYKLPIGSSKNDNDIEIDVEYRETATDITVSSNLISMRTNDVYNEKVIVTSRNDEFVYYEIYFTDENGNERLIQQKMSQDWSLSNYENYSDYVGAYETYINNCDNLLFNLIIDKTAENNELPFSLSVNKLSSAYQNRKNVNIYGTYRIVFYANELYNGVQKNFTFYLSEAEITNVETVNYSNMNDMSDRSEDIVPGQYGLLEVSIDPVDAEFDIFKISNNAINYNAGAGEVNFTFVYQNIVNGSVSYVADVNFGSTTNGTLTFSYEDYVNYLEDKGLSYNGKIYVRYILGSLGAESDMPIRFDIEVSYLNGQVEYDEVNLLTKLANYAHLAFNDREESDVYYVARGLSYDMTLTYYGFALSDIDITISNDVATLNGTGTNLTLDITDNVITPNDDVGYRFYIYVNASRIVNNVTVQYSEILTVYIMEFVFDYQYFEGEFEDIVHGMEGGVISTAVGNAYTLEVDVLDFIEYDATNNSVVRNVQEFINSLTNNATFKIYDSSTARDGLELTSSTNIRSDYYYINGLVFTGIRLYEPEQNIYHFSMEANFTRQNGLYVVVDASEVLDSQRIYTEFSFNIHQQSTDESPLPVETYEELMDMEDDQYYILLNDIVLPNSDNINAFTPITANVAGFDGNGYSFILSGNYNFDGTNIGIFETIGTSNNDAVVRNLTVELNANTIFNVTSSSFNLGLIAGSNSGIITNCEVISNNNSALSVSCSSSNSYVGGFVGTNSGIITNSRSAVSIFTNVNLAGFVGTNSGTISSSYYYGGSLRNTEASTHTLYTAGFAVVNSGVINTSYVSGTVSENEDVYSEDTLSFITSHNAISGFVFTNQSEISNCYSNIHINNTSYAAGFVFNNQTGGSVNSCFSTSVMINNNTLSYGFARANSGTIQDAFYLRDSEKNVNVSIATIDNSANVSIKALSIKEFNISDSNFAENFQNFVYSTNRGYNAVWFYNNTNSSVYYDEQVFNLNRLELVAPNIIAFSQRYLYSAEESVDAETGVTTVIYHYLNTAESGESGSVTNPILLDSAENFENYILNENNNNNYNHSYYRLINNIDYDDYNDNSELYKTRFMGYFEGNFLTVSNIHMVTSEKLTYAGLFAEVGSSTRDGAIGTVMNFNFEPAEMAFTNAQVAGGIAGRVDSGIITNVNLVSDDDFMISANNIAGGIAGIAVGRYDIENVTSNASTRATYIPSSTGGNEFNDNTSDFSRNSYSGSIVGVASGSGVVNKVSVSSSVSVIGSTAGTLIGMLGREASATNLTLTVDSDLMINAYYYGGLVIGESAGRVSEVEVIGTGLYGTIFNNIPYYPTAVGGVVGLMSSGQLDSVTANQSLSLSNSTRTEGVSYLGGLVGMVSGSVEISNIDIQGSYIGFNVVGGIIGGITGINAVVDLKNIDYTDGYLSVLSTQQSQATIGGIIGSTSSSTSINITADLSSTLTNNIKNYANSLLRDDENDDSYLEFTAPIEATNYALSTDIYTSDDRRTINSAYLNEANVIEFEANVLVYVYGTIMDIYLGEIVGYTDSNMVNVNNTVSSYTADIYSYNMAWSNPETYSERVYVTETSYNYNLHSNGGSVEGSGTMFMDTIDNSQTEAEGSIRHIIQSVSSNYTPSSTTAGVDGNVKTNNSFSVNMTDGKIADDFYVLPIYSHNVTYTFYMTGNASDHTLHLSDYGICVGQSFIGI